MKNTTIRSRDPASMVLHLAGANNGRAKLPLSREAGTRTDSAARREPRPALPQKGVRPLATRDDSETTYNGEGVRPPFEAKPPRPPDLRHRSGLTLLEIVLSLTIFFGSLAALSQLAWNGTRAVVQARLKTGAAIRCEAKLNEILAGIEPMQSCSHIPFPDDSHWTWSQIVIPSSYPELVQLELTVSHQGTSRLASVDVTLRRWARTKSLFVNEVTKAKEEADALAKPQQ